MRQSGFGGWAGLLLAVLTCAGPAWGQFVVDRHVMPVPQPVARSYEVRDVAVDARIRDGVAEVRVAQTFHNPGSTVIEAEYMFPLPDEAAVGDLVLMVDGHELTGRIMPKAEARRIYEEIVRTKRDPALLEYMGRGLFRASVFPIPPGADRVVTLKYTQVCKRERDVVEFAFPLALQKQAGQPIGKLNLNVRVDGHDAIKSVYCPGHDAKINRPTEREATATLDQANVIPTTDFRLVYTLGDGAVGASLLSYRPSEGEDGYFLLLASPRVKIAETKPLPKTVIFVIDRSGSMAGKKLDQARGALQFVLDNLRDDDTFNIIAYDTDVEAYKPELQRYSSKTREEATRFVANIRAGGGTNLDGGMKAALAQIPDESRPNYVLFLTDGIASAGETAELPIAANTRAANKGHARIFTFGLGFDVNARLLDRLSGGNGGTSEYVRPDEDIEAHVASFYTKVTRPALTGIAVELAGRAVNRTYPRAIPDLFEGGQLVWVGRYPTGGPTTIRLTGKVGGEPQSFEFPAELAGVNAASGRDFVEKLWAVRRVGFIIDQIDLNGPNQELTDELVSLSTRYGLLTPYTSFLADERVSLHARNENGNRARLNLSNLQVTQGQLGVNQRGMKQSYNQADKASIGPGYFPAASVGAGGFGSGMESSQGDRYAAAPATSPAIMGQGMGGGFAGGGAGIGGAGNFGGGMMLQGQQQGQGRSLSQPAAATPGRQQPGGLVARGAVEASKTASTDPAANVRRIGTKTFYRKEGRWVDAAIKPEADARAIVIEQFGDEFFKLAARQTAEQNQYFAFDEPFAVQINDQVYRVNLPKNR